MNNTPRCKIATEASSVDVSIAAIVGEQSDNLPGVPGVGAGFAGLLAARESIGADERVAVVFSGIRR